MITAECLYLTRQNYLEYDFKFMKTINRLAALRNRMERESGFLKNYAENAEPLQTAAMLSRRFREYCEAFTDACAPVSRERKIPYFIMASRTEPAKTKRTEIKKQIRSLNSDLKLLHQETVYQLRLYIKRRDITFNYAVSHGLYPAKLQLIPSPEYCMTRAAMLRAERALHDRWRVPENLGKKRVLIRDLNEMLRVPLELSWEWLLYAMWQRIFRSGISSEDYVPHVRMLAEQLTEYRLIPDSAVNARYLCELLAQGAVVPGMSWTVKSFGDVFFSVRSLIRLPQPFYAVTDRIGYGIWKMACL